MDPEIPLPPPFPFSELLLFFLKIKKYSWKDNWTEGCQVLYEETYFPTHFFAFHLAQS